MVKIALVGTHGVGKTTIAYELAGLIKRRGRSVELVTEIARECPLPLNELATREAYQWVIARQVQLEIEKKPRAEFLVCDRSVLDNFAYYARKYGLSDNESQSLLAYCRSWITTYDLLVRFPVTDRLTEDGFRSTDSAFQREVDFWCDELFDSQYDLKSRPRYVRGPLSAEQIAELIFS